MRHSLYVYSSFQSVARSSANANTMARRPHITLMLVAGVMIFLTMTYLVSGRSSMDDFRPSNIHPADHKEAISSTGDHKPVAGISDRILSGGSIAPKLENATAK